MATIWEGVALSVNHVFSLHYVYFVFLAGSHFGFEAVSWL